MTTSRKICQSGHPCTPATLKEALDCLGHHGALTVRQLAERLGHISEGTLGKQLSQYDEDNYPPIRQVVPLTLASENDALITHLARAVGGVFVRVPTAAGTVESQAFARMVKEFGELLAAVAEAWADDGHVTPDELDRVEREWLDVATAGAAYVEQLRLAVSTTTAPTLRKSA